MSGPQILTPREIVSELDKFIIGQHKAKRSVAIALRNRWRRQQVPEDLQDEIAPKNIIMIGPTGGTRSASAPTARSSCRSASTSSLVGQAIVLGGLPFHSS